MEKFYEGRMFLQKAFEKILADKDIKKCPELRQSCEEYLDQLKVEIQSIRSSDPSSKVNDDASSLASPKSTHSESGSVSSSALPAASSESDYVNADYYFEPFKLACKAKSTRIVITALDSIQKLVAYGHLRGQIADPNTPEQPLANTIVDTICECFIGVQTDENVQLQIIKALLTCMTSLTLEVHEGALLQTVRTVYNIYLASKSLVNQRTAQAALTQMLNVLFSKMETDCAPEKPMLPQATDSTTSVNNSQQSPQTRNQDGTAQQDKSPPANQNDDTMSQSSKHSEMSTGASEQHTNSKSDTSYLTTDQADNDSENTDGVSNMTIVSEPTTEHGESKSDEPQYSETPNAEVPTKIQESSEAINGHDNVPEERPEEESKEAAVQSILDDIVTMATGIASADKTVVNGPLNGSTGSLPTNIEDDESSVNTGAVSPPNFLHISQKDALIVFRALCKLSMKPLGEGPPDARSHEYRSKVLSLRLLLAVLQNAGPVFKSARLFVEVIKQYLCVALSKNGVSPVAEIFELSLNIFLALYANFKQHLKVQIEVFIREIFLTILESSMSSFDHKWLVIGALKMICSEPQNVVDIYLNYDCDLSSANVFERLVNDLSKIAQGLHSIQLGATPLQTKSIRIKGLQCLVDILRCMVQWSHDLYYNPNDQSQIGGKSDKIAPQHRSSITNLSINPASSAGDNESNLDVPSIASTSVTVPTTDGTESPSKLGGSMSSLNSIGNNSTSADNPAVFENIKQQKEVLEQGLDLFNKKPKKGLQFLQNHGLLSLSPEKVAEFLHQHEEKLDPTMMGDFLGEGDDFNKAVMYAYVDQFDFQEKDFLTALRQFLEGFRLPGEAQKIDRLMEKFASRYCETNPHQGIFATADTAYVLAFSIIMLTTDLHSDQIKTHMTKADYIKMNKGINDSRDLPEEYLSSIYDQIARNKIKMRHTREQKSLKPAVDVSNDKVRRSEYEKEIQYMARTAMSLLEAASTVQTTYTSATHYQHVKPMFKIAWTPLLAAFSVGLQDCDDVQISSLCLEGIRHAIRISCIFRMDIEKDAYVQALSRFTLLTATSGLHEMKSKNIETIKTLIHVAHTDGNYLGTSWGEVLRCISQLELAQMIGTGVKPHYLQDKKPASKLSPIPRIDGSITGPGALEILGSLDQKKLMHIQESVQETSSQSVVVAVDRVFTGSIRLDGDAIVDFVHWLCHVSMEELQQPKAPRMFSLTKLVEISYYNMGRIRLQWSRIWQVLGEHFNRVGCFPNEHVAFFAVDSLRQLSMKFIEKGELSGYRFQKEFLRPFEYIMKKNRSPTIRDMVVRCIAQMVQSQAGNIKSGWKNIFAVFHLAASDPDETIVELAFQTTAKIITSVFQTCFGSAVIDAFQDAVKCLSEFTCSAAFPDTSMEAIRLIRECAQIVNANPQGFSENWNEEFVTVPEHDRIWVRGWFPILFELNCVITRCKLDVRTRALTVMFELLKTFAGSFKENWWKDLLQVIFRLFDVNKMEEKKIDKIEWLTTTCNHALYALIDVYSQYRSVLSEIVFEDLLSQIIWCCKQQNEQLARAGINCLENFLISNGTEMTEIQWDIVCKAVQQLFRDTLAHDLLTWVPPSRGGVGAEFGTPSFASSLICCVVQLELIHAIDGVLFLPLTSRREDECYLQAAKDVEILAPNRIDEHSDGMIHTLSSRHLVSLLDSLIESHKFARTFNSDNEQRTLLWKAGFKGKNKPNLIQQETSSLACAFRLLFSILNNDKHESAWDDLENRLNTLCKEAFEYYITLSNGHRDSWTSLLILLLTKILQMDEVKFSQHFFRFYQHLCEMIAMDLKPELRAILRKVFLRLPGSSKNHFNLSASNYNTANGISEDSDLNLS